MATGLFGMAGVDHDLGHLTRNAGVFGIEFVDEFKLDSGDIVTLRSNGELTEQKVGLGVGRFEFEDSSIFLSGFGESIHGDEEFTEVEQCVDIAGIFAEVSQVEAIGLFVLAFDGVDGSKPGVDSTHSWVEPGGFLEAPDGFVVQVSLEQAFTEVGVADRAFFLDQPGHVVDLLGLIMFAKHGERDDLGAVRRLKIGIEFLRDSKMLERFFRSIQSVVVDAEADEWMWIFRREFMGSVEGDDGFLGSTGGFECETEVELPFGLFRIHGQRFAQLRLRFLPSPEFVILVRPFDMFFSVVPLVHVVTVGPSGDRLLVPSVITLLLISLGTGRSFFFSSDTVFVCNDSFLCVDDLC